MNRRNFGRLLAGLGAVQGLVLARSAQAAKPQLSAANRAPVVGDRSQATLDEINTYLGGDAIRVGIVMYPGMVSNDVSSLITVFQSLGGTIISLLARRNEPVGSDDREVPALVPIPPNTTFEEAAEGYEVLVVPGSLPGKYGPLEDAELLDFIRSRAAKSQWVASVGSGSLLLAAAGLLQGHKATTFWPMRPLLKDLGVSVVDKRVVVDGKWVTSSGTTSAFDLGLTLIEKLRNAAQAQLVQLYLEYDPQPPFKGGTPEKTAAPITSFMNVMYRETVQSGREVTQRVVNTLKANAKKK